MTRRMYASARGIALWLAVCLLLCMPALPAPARAAGGATDGMVRVYLSSLGSPTRLDITVNGSYSLDGTQGTALARGSTVTVTMNAATGRLTLTRGGVSTDMGTEFTLRRHAASGDNGLTISQSRVNTNLYPGDLQLRAVKNGASYRLYPIVHVYIEEYLYGVLPYEMGNSAPLEALKAQCVSARTYTVRAMQSSAARSYDVVDTTNDQVYNGTPAGNTRCRQAVDETRGIVAMNGTAFTATFYTASNGGQIESVANLWNSTGYEYIRVKDDPYDYQNSASVVRSFSVVARGAQSNAALSTLLVNKARETFGAQSVVIEEVAAVTPHTPRFAAPSRLYTKLDFDVTALADGRRQSGTLTFDIFSELESALGMSINADKNELWSVVATATGYTVQARRFGHGTGLSQRGAMRMGELGYTYEQILAFYFEGCQRVQYSFVRSVLGALGTSSSASPQLSTDTPAQLTQSAAGAAMVNLSSAGAEMALRVSAAYGSDIITGIPHGASVNVHAAAGEWYLITYGSLTGYAHRDGLQLSGAIDGQTPRVTTLEGYGTVRSSDSLNLRAGPGTNTAVLGQVPSGTVLPLLSVSDGWGYTQYGRLTGYVSMDYITRSDRYTGAATDAGASGAEVTVAGGAPLYASANPYGYQLAQVPQSAVVKIKYDDGSWSEVYYSGMTGYMLSRTLRRNGITVEETPEAPGSGEQYAVVKAAPSLNLRQSASESAPVVMEIPNGETVIVVSAGASWCRVRYHGVEGWCATAYLSIGQSGGTGGELTARVTTESGTLNLRESDSTNARVLTKIPRHATISVLSRGATWCKVTYGGFIGYVMTRYLTFNDETAPSAPVTPPAGAATAAPTGTPSSARVTTASGSLNLRKKASTDAGIMTSIPRGTVIEVLEIVGAWTKVTYNGRTGYVMSSFLTYLTEGDGGETTQPPVTETTVYARVTTVSGSLNLRKRASTSGELILRIPQNEVIPVLEQLGAWCKVTYEGRTGYVMTSFLTFVEVGEAATARPTENVSGQYVTAQVTTQKGSLNLRQRASASASILTTIPQYAFVTVLSRGSEWSEVTYGRYRGYVKSSFLTFHTEEAATSAPTAPVGVDETRARVITDAGPLNLRESASENARIVFEIPRGDIVLVLEKGAVWCRVSYEGATGYVRSEYLAFLSATATPFAPADDGMTAQGTARAARVSAAGGSVTLRASASENGAALAIILSGEYVLRLAEGNGWARVQYEGMTGYLPLSCLEP